MAESLRSAITNKMLALHPSITLERVVEAVQADEDVGFCIGCGSERSGCEPDAEAYTCEVCKQPYVYGAEELLIALEDILT